MALVVKPITVPAALSGQSNGRLASSLLWSTPGLSGGPTVRLLIVAARAWRAMAAAAQAGGIVLKTAGYADSYRTYDQQVALFTSRYQIEPTLNGWKLWDSDGSGTAERWYKKDGVATAAVPGKSNHGWALAVDISGASGARLDWLQDHALSFGWSWELVPEEPWHLHYYTGDAIPKAVLDYEEAQMGLEEWTATPGQPTWALTQGSPNYAGAQRDTALAFAWQSANEANQKTDKALTALSALQSKVDQILALMQAGGGQPPSGPVDLSDTAKADIRTIVDEELDEAFRAGADSGT